MIEKVIAIGGVSRSGKSTLAEFLRVHFSTQDQKCSILSQDDYCLPEDEIPKIQDRIDWETPKSVDWEKWHYALNQAISESQIVLLEGLFIFDDPSTPISFDAQVFIEISWKTFLTRRKEETRWGPEPDWYIEYVWNSFQMRKRIPKDAYLLSGEKQFRLADILKNLAL